MSKYVKMKEAQKVLGLHPNTFRRLADAGKIKHIKTPNGTRMYDISDYIPRDEATICYCRVSSRKQKDDLERQVAFMQEKYPEAEVVTDIGSGLNFKRKGLKSILERAMSGEKLTIVVAYKDRLARFGTEIIEQVIAHNDGTVVVLHNEDKSPAQELAEDILAITHVFSCRLNGLRKYSKLLEEDKDLLEQGSEEVS